MTRSYALFLLAVAVSATPPTPSLDGQWGQFKLHYNKTYKPEEEAKRRLIWEDNLKFILTHNLEADRGLHTFTVGENKFADMTAQEFAQTMNGFRAPNNTLSTKGTTYLPPSNVKIPDSVDWRTQGYVTPVKNQGQCGSCWAFSTTGSLEGQHFKKTGTLVSLSEQNLVDCSGPEGNAGCNGGLMDQAFKYINTNKGVDNELSYPYEAVDGRCRFRVADVGATDAGYTDITRGSEADLQSAVASVGPISVAIDASRSSFQLYKSGVYYEKDCSTESLDHGVLAVGYGSENNLDYWIVKNSWGSDWGMEGYLKMSRNRGNNCGIATQASYPLV